MSSVVFGVDPGARDFAVVAVRDGVIVTAETLRAGASPASDWNVTAPLLTKLARDAWREIEDTDCMESFRDTLRIHVAVESYVYIGGRINQHFWKGPAVCGAFAALAPPWATLHWQTSSAVLSEHSYGPLKELLRTNGAKRVDPEGLVTNEHTASAACHALYLDANIRQGVLDV